MKSLTKYESRIARASEGQLVALLSNSSMLFAWVSTDAARAELVSFATKRLVALRKAAPKAAQCTTQARINRAMFLIAQDKAAAKAVANLIKTAREGVLVTAEVIATVEAKLGFQLTGGQLKAIFFAFQNGGHFEEAIKFASSVSTSFVMEVHSSIRWMEKNIIGGLIVRLGVAASKGISKFGGIMKAAFAVAGITV